MSRFYLLVINGAALIGCAVFDFSWRSTLLTGLMFFLPVLDKYWSRPEFSLNKTKYVTWSALLLACLIVIINKPDYAIFAVTSLLFVALPEEWFFRAYFMQQIQNKWNMPWTANVITSTLFTLLHLPTQGWLGLSVFVPSLFYGWLYQRTDDLVLLILLHALSNLIFIIYLVEYFRKFIDLI